MRSTCVFILLLLALPLRAQVDADLNQATEALHNYLNQISLSFTQDQKILLGQQNSFLEGRGWRLSNSDLGRPLRSDMHDVSGIHPAVFGFDFREVGPWNRELILEKVWEVKKKKGVVTISWHMDTLIDDGKGKGDFYDVTARVVKHILPGGHAHSKFTAKLDDLVAFLLEVRDVPIVFRPWHEHNFSWFWWGAQHCTREEYIALWRFTVDYLKKNSVHNLLYAYSPAHLSDDYFERYPGDEYVDILGTDFYFKNPAQDATTLGGNPLAQWKRKIIWFMREADKRNKIPVLAEFGQEGIKYKKFWTDYFGWPLERKGVEQITGPDDLPKRGIAWVLLWRNDMSSPTHFFGPVPGHNENENFLSLLSKGIYQGLEN